MEKKAKIMLIGGHLTPALAVAEELKPAFTLVWAGIMHSQTSDKRNSAEYEAVQQLGIKFVPFQAGKLWRKWTLPTFLKALYNLLLIPWGFIRAFWLVLIIRPAVVVSFGGYLALPLVVAGRVLGSKVITHEQTTTVGLANKLIGRFAHKICISWPQTASFTPAGKTVLTGNPIRGNLFTVTTNAFNFADKLPVIFVTGGNQGANTFNWRLRHVISDILQHANVIHQTGNSLITNDFQLANEVRAKLPENLQSRYIVRDRIFGAEISEAFNKADLLLARAGANTVSEILALGKPAVLIPIPWSSNNEQQQNAEMVAETGLAMVVKQYDAMPPEELRDNLLHALQTVTQQTAFNGTSIAEARKLAMSLVIPDAAKKIAREVTSLL